MKRNPILRIVLWSLLALILLGILITGLFGYVGRNSYRFDNHEIVVTSPLASEEALIDRTIPKDTAASQTEPTPAPVDGIPIDLKQVQNLEIEWPAGSVTIVPSDVDQILLSETPVDRPEEQLAYSLRGRTLHIRYYEKKTNPNFNLKHSKDLTILVPRDFSLTTLDLDTASADLSVTDMTIGQADVDGASGRSRFENCQLGSLNMDTVSGDVFVSGTATELDVDSISAAVEAQLTNVPSKISADAVSGSLELTLPKDAGFTLELETLSGNFRSDFDTTKNGSIYRSGDGRCQIELEAVSGDITIQKGA